MPVLRLLVVAGLIALAGCSNSTGSSNPPPPPPPPAPPPAPPPPPPGGHSTTITVGNDFFSPTPDTIPAGMITFEWDTPSNGHNVTWQNGPGTLPAASATKTSGTYEATLVQGTYNYHCTIHGGMTGRIVVQ
jgi:hypothetical protein